METPRRSSSRLKSITSYRQKESSDEEEEEKETYKMEKRPRFLSLDDCCQISGKQVYQFKTPKRKGQMVEKANKSASKKVEFENEEEEEEGEDVRQKKDRSSSSKRRTLSETKAKDRMPSRTDVDRTQPETPYSLRRRIKKKLIKMTDEDEEDKSTDESSCGSDQENEDEEGGGEGGERSSSSSSGTKGKTSKAKRETSSMQTKAEDFFVAREQRSKTSDNTLARLDVSSFDQLTLKETLDKVPRSHQSECERLNLVYRQNFEKWIFQLSNGFNLLLYGLGSKLELLSDFREMLTDEDETVLVVNGFFPTVSIKQILNSITEDVLENKGNFTKLEEQVDFIRNSLRHNSDNGELYLIINNIDGSMLRNEKTQSILCSLAQIKEIRLVASVDHINAPLLWDQAKMNAFSWIWYDVTTFEPYVRETSYENSLLVKQTGSLAISSLIHVFKSLTPNAQGIFILIARYQIDHEQTNYIGMAFKDCYMKCREAFLVNSQLTLKAQLTEFKDHKLIRVKKGADGAEYLHILLDSATIQEFLQQQKIKS